MIKILLIIASISFTACMENTKLKTVGSVDLDRYMGKWYEIAAYPHKFEMGCSCTTAEYELTDKDYVRVINSCKRNGSVSSIEGKAFIQKGSNNSKLKVQFFWPFRGKYWIIDLADDYSWAVVSHPSKNYLWILARKPSMDEQLFDKILQKLDKLGFDLKKIKKIVHDCE
ncbi:MAG: lipocalin family protein [Bacteroidota bacterium]